MRDLELLLDTVTFEPECLAQTAWSGHLPYAHYVIRKLKPKVVVELGTHRGSSYFAMCQTIKQFSIEAKTFAVDTWQGEAHAGLYDDSVFQAVDAENKKYDSFSTLLRSTFDDALNSFADGSIDLLHIDGFHTYEAVKHDFESWFPKLSKGATVLFHDTSEKRDDFGVYIFWEELMKQYDGFEFQHSHGLGVMQLPGAKVNLVPKGEDLARHLRFFEQVGMITDAKVLQQQVGAQTLPALVNQLTRRIAQLESSSSWKITAPMRAISGLLKKK